MFSAKHCRFFQFVWLFVLILYIPVNNLSVMSGLPVSNQYKAKDKLSYSSAQCSASSEPLTHNPRSRVKSVTDLAMKI